MRQRGSGPRRRRCARGRGLVGRGRSVRIGVHGSGVSKGDVTGDLRRLRRDTSPRGNAPELLDRVLFAGEEQPLERLSLDADNQTCSQDGEEGHQDAHGQAPAVCSRGQVGRETGTSLNEFFRGGWLGRFILIQKVWKYRNNAELDVLQPKLPGLPANLIGPLSTLPPKPALSQKGGAQWASQWQFLLLLHTCGG